MAAILPPLRDRIRRRCACCLSASTPASARRRSAIISPAPSNRFWKLLYESRLVPEPIGFADDDRLPEWGFGITNLIPRPTPGIDTLRAEEYVAGARVLRRKIRRVKPGVVAFIGVTLFRSVFGPAGGSAGRAGSAGENGSKARVSSCCRTRAAATRTFPTPRCSMRSRGSAARWRDDERNSQQSAVGRHRRAVFRALAAAALCWRAPHTRARRIRCASPARPASRRRDCTVPTRTARRTASSTRATSSR